jgi:hypothetical protein
MNEGTGDPSLWRTVSPTGLEYLSMVTELLQRARKVNEFDGLFEAADLQWWWRKDQHHDPRTQQFILDDRGPRAAYVITNWGAYRCLDLFFAEPDHRAELDMLWSSALEASAAESETPVEMEISDGDDELVQRAIAAGFHASDDAYWSSWMRPDELHELTPLREGLTLVTRHENRQRPHPMVARNGDDIEERLNECSLYRADLDLAVYSAEGELAGYSLYWFDPVTLVGYVEPMRCEEPFQRQGIANFMLGEGLRRLVELGSTRLKVSSDLHLYLQAGFQPTTHSTVFRQDVGEARTI